MMNKKYRGEQTTTDELEQEVAKMQEDRQKVGEASEAAQGDKESEAALNAADNESLSETERTWAKRYADGRKYQQEQSDKFKAKEEELQQKLDELKNAQTTLPTNEDDLKAWMEEHGEVSNIVHTIATKEAGKAAEAATKELREQIAKLEKENTVLSAKESKAAVMAAHPDYSELENSVEFHDWVDKKGGWVQSAMYAGTEAQPAIDAINLYKAENGLFAPKEETKKRGRGRPPKDEAAAAATVVTKSTNGGPDTSSTDKKIWKDSDVAKLTGPELPKLFPR